MDFVTDDEESSDEENAMDDEENTADDEEDGPDYAKMPDAECVRYWALAGNESLATVGRMLEMLRAKTDMYIPKDPRTVLRTKRDRAALSIIGDGRFWYHGISKCLLAEMRKHATVSEVIQFDINIDGLPLHSRSRTQFWPILLKVVDEPDWPIMVVGIYSGQSKPQSNDQFLRPLVEEINVLFRTGLVINEATIRVYLRAIIADTPARAFIKGVQGHMGKHSCLKCCCEGETVQQRTVFLETNADQRTDDAFRNNEYVLHQTGTTPLIDLENFDMIEDVIVGDRLHQIDIGVTKKLLNIWYVGVLRSTRRWNQGQRKVINQRLQSQTFPFETPRKLHCLDDLAYWKGSECKAFLHYAAPVVLRGVLTEEQYQHFMLYFCGVTIFSSKAHKRHWSTGSELLKKFVESYAQVYGKAGVTSNVHSLIHIFEEAIRFGNLDSYSTYVFERKLGQIKNKLIKSSYRCLEQVIRRILELENFDFPRKRKQFPFFKQRGQNIKLFVRKGFIMSNDGVNDWFLSKHNHVVTE
ncbi:uncharacterized protein LOC131285620 [Anopheles ziemanni]|uniref:uncharacterized protein LOC131267628 n=1 Tax=Anopheles coustani TaxID=139045 RepID=UPI00265A8827|nr:uncharacterized protein LOC131267628 [Anopheles coustani]XP_058170463.1 uncharacterized protein LOC131285620 [Anopheles ziemanni]